MIPPQAGKEAEWTFKWIIGSLSKKITFYFSVARECCSLARECLPFQTIGICLKLKSVWRCFLLWKCSLDEMSSQVAVTQKKTVVQQFHWGTSASLHYTRNLCCQDTCTELNIIKQLRRKQDLWKICCNISYDTETRREENIADSLLKLCLFTEFLCIWTGKKNNAWMSLCF